MVHPREIFFNRIIEETVNMTAKDACAHFEKEKNTAPAARQETKEAFAHYWLLRTATQREQERTAAPARAEQLWDAVRAWKPDPMSESASADPTAIFKYLGSDRFDPVPLGKYKGRWMCRLEPTIALEPDQIHYDPPLPFSISNHKGVRAIKYADGLPSEEFFHLTTTPEGSKAGGSKAKKSGTNWVEAKQDDILRRFFSLGWVHMWIDDEWVKTGHSLVLDASHGRSVHPWFVLAEEWHTDDERLIAEHDSEFVRPPAHVDLNDTKALGVLPATHNRTTIAPLMHYGRKGGQKMFFENFSETFSFDLKWQGKEKPKSTPVQCRGPDLCEIMNWHWDPENEEEVCFTKARIEYMRFNPRTRCYSGPGRPISEEIGNLVEQGNRDEPKGLPTRPVENSSNGQSRGRGYGHGHGHLAGPSSVYSEEVR